MQSAAASMAALYSLLTTQLLQRSSRSLMRDNHNECSTPSSYWAKAAPVLF